jgi:hypothetical protein
LGDSFEKSLSGKNLHGLEPAQLDQMSVAGNNIISASGQGGLQEFIIIGVCFNCSQLPADFHSPSDFLDKADRLCNFILAQQNFFGQDFREFFHDRVGNDQFKQAGFRSHYASIGSASPEKRRDQDIGIEDGFNQLLPVQNAVNQFFSLSIAQAGEIDPALPAHCLKLILVPVDYSVQAAQAPDKFAQGLFFPLTGKFAQGLQNLLFAHLRSHDSPP